MRQRLCKSISACFQSSAGLCWCLFPSLCCLTPCRIWLGVGLRSLHVLLLAVTSASCRRTLTTQQTIRTRTSAARRRGAAGPVTSTARKTLYECLESARSTRVGTASSSGCVTAKSKARIPNPPSPHPRSNHTTSRMLCHACTANTPVATST
jgi:hypothetical protein